MATMRSLMYVSRSMPWFRPDPGTDEIVEESVPWNAEYGITGALIYSAGYFAQFIEGPRDSIELLLTRLRRDPRHFALTVVRDQDDWYRLFAGWNLAYAGDAGFVEKDLADLFRHAQRGLNDPDAAAHDEAARVIEVMYEFVHGQAATEKDFH